MLTYCNIGKINYYKVPSQTIMTVNHEALQLILSITIWFYEHYDKLWLCNFFIKKEFMCLFVHDIWQEVSMIWQIISAASIWNYLNTENGIVFKRFLWTCMFSSPSLIVLSFQSNSTDALCVSCWPLVWCTPQNFFSAFQSWQLLFKHDQQWCVVLSW